MRKRGNVKPPLPLADTPGEGSRSAGWQDDAAADADDDVDADAAAAAVVDADADEVSASFASINLTTKGAKLGGGGL